MAERRLRDLTGPRLRHPLAAFTVEHDGAAEAIGPVGITQMGDRLVELILRVGARSVRAPLAIGGWLGTHDPPPAATGSASGSSAFGSPLAM
jgi:hypothetical protein